jgi:hypothetical protein
MTAGTRSQGSCRPGLPRSSTFLARATSTAATQAPGRRGAARQALARERWRPAAGPARWCVRAKRGLAGGDPHGLPRYVQTEAFLESRRIPARARYDIPQGGLAEAWDLFLPRRRQLFFYDDFLGRISLAPGQEDDEVLMRFMRRVARSKTKRMVLTTREYVLRQAQQLSEVLEREDVRPAPIPAACRSLRPPREGSHLLQPHLLLGPGGYHRAWRSSQRAGVPTHNRPSQLQPEWMRPVPTE